MRKYKKILVKSLMIFLTVPIRANSPFKKKKSNSPSKQNNSLDTDVSIGLLLYTLSMIRITILGSKLIQRKRNRKEDEL